MLQPSTSPAETSSHGDRLRVEFSRRRFQIVELANQGDVPSVPFQLWKPADPRPDPAEPVVISSSHPH
jgi:hypothetical protein